MSNIIQGDCIEQMKKKYDNESVEFGFKCGYEKRETEIIERLKKRWESNITVISKRELLNELKQIKEQNGSNKEDMIFKSKDKEMLRMKASGNWNEHKVPSKELKIKEQNGSVDN